MAKYKDIWTEALPDIFYHLDRSRYYHRDEKVSLSKDDFLEIGERFSSGYTFLLKILNGALANNVSGTIVARDLFDVLTENDHIRAWMADKLLELRLTNNFSLSLKVIELKDSKSSSKPSTDDEESEERADWRQLGMQALAASYGDDEPDYSDVALLEPNPDYDPS